MQVTQLTSVMYFPSNRREEVSETNFSADTRGGGWWLPRKLLSPRSFCRPPLGMWPSDSRWPLIEDHDHEVALVISSVACQRAAATIAHPDTAHQTSDFLYHDFTMGFCFIKCLELVLSSKSEKYSLKADLYGMIKMFWSTLLCLLLIAFLFISKQLITI